jgi:protein-L-isoaspartate(D-aspartate) O-methyltransferase
MNIEEARFNMVEQQVRTWDVLDQNVLGLMERAPREAFVPEAFRTLAYADISVPLAHGQCMLPPRIEARMLQSLRLDSADRVLEIGTGSGFFTYMLAALAGHVVSVELHPDLLESARLRLEAHNAFNITLEQGDGVAGRASGAPYDVIAMTGSIPILSEQLEQQLSIGGRLFVVVGEAPAMEAMLIERLSESQWRRDELFETVIPPLTGAPSHSQFEF